VGQSGAQFVSLLSQLPQLLGRAFLFRQMSLGGSNLRAQLLLQLLADALLRCLCGDQQLAQFEDFFLGLAQYPLAADMGSFRFDGPLLECRACCCPLVAFLAERGQGSLRRLQWFCRVVDQSVNFSLNGTAPSNWTDLSRKRIKLVGERHRIGSVDCELALADHVHELDAGEHGAGCVE